MTLPLDSVNEVVQRPGTSLREIVSTVLEGYADRPALGERATELVTDPATGRTSLRLLSRFDTITYRQLSDRVEAVAAEWAGHTDAPLATGDAVAVLGFTSADYTTVDLACVRLGAVSVPLQSSASAATLAPIVAEYAIHDAEDGTVTMIEKWDSRDAHAAGPAVKALQAAVTGLLAGPATVTTMTPLPAGTVAQGEL